MTMPGLPRRLEVPTSDDDIRAMRKALEKFAAQKNWALIITGEGRKVYVWMPDGAPADIAIDALKRIEGKL